jgi:hypothetical protein
VISATGGAGGAGYNGGVGSAGSLGRVRFEYTNISRTAVNSPVPVLVNTPGPITVLNMPVLSIASVGGVEAPLSPKGSFGSPDVLLPYNATNPVAIVVNGTNIPAGQTVTVKATPSSGTATSTTSTLAGTGPSTSATVSLNLATGYPSLITATVTYQLASLNLPEFYLNGEKIASVRVASTLGAASTVTYLTEDGKEIPAL